MILNVDPFLEPANGPNYFPFDPNVLYEMKIDNNRDGVEDVVFQFRFQTEIRQPGLFTGFAGGINGIPPITSLSGVGSAGFSLRQTYTVYMVKNGQSTCLSCGQTLYAVPSNVGPLTMPTYQTLFNQGIYSLGNNVRTWAGTADDPFFIDLGAAFDSLNFRMGVGGVLPPAEDADDTQLRSRCCSGLQRQLNRVGSAHHHVDGRRPAPQFQRQECGDWNLGNHVS
jgi:Domain of unknown function (DUF4331)